MAQYFDGISALSRSASLSLNGDCLDWHLASSEASGSWRLSECRVEKRATGGASVLRGDAAFVFTEEEWREFSRLYPSLGARLSSHVDARRSRALPYLLGAACALLLFAFALSRASGLIASWISVEQEQRYFRDTRAGARVEYPEQVRQLQLIMRRLRPARDLEIRWSDSETVNGYAMAGATIEITRGLVCFVEDPEEIAAVVAHEIEHIERRHILKQVIEQTGLSFFWTLALGDAGRTAAGSLAQGFISSRYSVTDEAEADAGAADRLLASRLGTQGAVRFFARIQAEEKSRLLESLFRSHPPTPERISYFKGRMPAGTSVPKALPDQAPLLTADEWETLRGLARCHSPRKP